MSVLRVVDCTRKLLSVKVETLKNEQKVSVRVGINQELRLIFNSLSLQLLLDPRRKKVTTVLAFGNSTLSSILLFSLVFLVLSCLRAPSDFLEKQKLSGIFYNLKTTKNI